MVRSAEDYQKFKRAKKYWEEEAGETPLGKRYKTPEGKYKFTPDMLRMKKRAVSYAEREVPPEAKRLRHWDPSAIVEGEFRRQKSKGRRKANSKKRSKKRTVKKRTKKS